MAREILFKAKGISDGKWVEGLLTIMWGQYHIINPNDENTAYPIDTDTICQYTGLTDKNGNKIWENDVVKYKNADGIKFNGTTLTVIGKVVYNEKTASFAVYGKDEIGGKHCDYFPIKNVEVIGNIFDNPDLLEEKHE